MRPRSDLMRQLVGNRPCVAWQGKACAAMHQTQEVEEEIAMS